MNSKLLLISIFLLLSSTCYAGDVEYRTGGARFDKVWQAFYMGAVLESDIDEPLIKAGRSMVPAICEAISHKDMKRRRYAIGALGFIGDRRAIPKLEAILINKEEITYFRGDALESIFQIDKKLGTKYANQYAYDNDEYLAMIAGYMLIPKE